MVDATAKSTPANPSQGSSQSSLQSTLAGRTAPLGQRVLHAGNFRDAQLQHKCSRQRNRPEPPSLDRRVHKRSQTRKDECIGLEPRAYLEPRVRQDIPVALGGPGRVVELEQQRVANYEAVAMKVIRHQDVSAVRMTLRGAGGDVVVEVKSDGMGVSHAVVAGCDAQLETRLQEALAGIARGSK